MPLALWLRPPTHEPDGRHVATTAKVPTIIPHSEPIRWSPTNKHPMELVAETSTHLEDIQPIWDFQAPYTKRSAAIQRLRGGITTEEKRALYGYLATYSAEDETQIGHVLKNNVMSALVAQHPTLPDLAPQLVAISANPGLHVVIRDYAVQHCVVLYEELNQIPEAQVSRRHLRDGLYQALTETNNSLAGTALLGMSRLSLEDADFDRGRIQRAALKCATDSRTGELARITALQVCAQMGLETALPVCVSLAEGTGDAPLRLSAIAALGQLGGAEAVPLLTHILAEKNDRFHPAATRALKRLQERLTAAIPANQRSPSYP